MGSRIPGSCSLVWGTSGNVEFRIGIDWIKEAERKTKNQKTKKRRKKKKTKEKTKWMEWWSSRDSLSWLFLMGSWWKSIFLSDRRSIGGQTSKFVGLIKKTKVIWISNQRLSIPGLCSLIQGHSGNVEIRIRNRWNQGGWRKSEEKTRISKKNEKTGKKRNERMTSGGKGSLLSLWLTNTFSKNQTTSRCTLWDYWSWNLFALCWREVHSFTPKTNKKRTTFQKKTDSFSSTSSSFSHQRWVSEYSWWVNSLFPSKIIFSRSTRKRNKDEISGSHFISRISPSATDFFFILSSNNREGEMNSNFKKVSSNKTHKKRGVVVLKEKGERRKKMFPVFVDKSLFVVLDWMACVIFHSASLSLFFSLLLMMIMEKERITASFSIIFRLCLDSSLLSTGRFAECDSHAQRERKIWECRGRCTHAHWNREKERERESNSREAQTALHVTIKLHAKRERDIVAALIDVGGGETGRTGIPS